MGALENAVKRRRMISAERLIAMKYKTESGNVACVITEIIPIDKYAGSSPTK